MSNYELSQLEIQELGRGVVNNIDKFFDVLGLTDSMRLSKKMYIGPCPVHGGDNITAFNIWYEGDTVVGNWKCRTHMCEKHFVSSAIGFIRGVLSHNKHQWAGRGDDMVSFPDTIEFIMDTLNITSEQLKNKHQDFFSKVDEVGFTWQSEALSFTNKAYTLSDKPLLNRQQARSRLLVPSKFMMEGEHSYSSNILNKYDVGYCNEKGKPMYCRSVVPVYDDDHEFVVGCSGRSIFGKCPDCGWHHPGDECPPKERQPMFCKWKHMGFNVENILYNYWYAKEYIKKSNVIVLVESPGNVWRLEEAGIHNSVALFGAALKDGQRFLLDCSGALAIITIMDNDAAGKKAAYCIERDCELTYHVENIEIKAPDIGKMTVGEVHSDILPIVRNIEKRMKL